jgi:hypothetical protein
VVIIINQIGKTHRYVVACAEGSKINSSLCCLYFWCSHNRLGNRWNNQRFGSRIPASKHLFLIWSLVISGILGSWEGKPSNQLWIWNCMAYTTHLAFPPLDHRILNALCGVPQGKVTAAQCAHSIHANWPADISGPIYAPCMQLRSLRLWHLFILLRSKLWVAWRLNQNCAWALYLSIILAGTWKHFLFASIHFILCCPQVLDVLCACQ